MIRFKNFQHNHFLNPDRLALALADRVSRELTHAVNERGRAVIAVSGGSTPKRFFYYLSQKDLLWEKIIITLVDERFVPLRSDRSNENLVRRCLLQDCASKAGFVGLYCQEKTAERAACFAEAKINKLHRPFDVVVLGMGLDGHTASFFPQGDRLKLAIDSKSRLLVIPMYAEGLDEPRLTLTLPILVNAGFIALHIEGKEKLVIFDKALRNGLDTDMPIRAILSYAKSPLQVFWSPT
ncbi:MAG: 6-phosphogluconolactonase [Candidatus Tokpelaia sp. JSC161]|nr:MAG: 6-phosphogluconolactonase [Candidatus Tokpelaia sp. JSC161]